MKVNSRLLQKRYSKRLGVGNLQLAITILVMMVIFIPSSTLGIINLWDAPQGLADLDNRTGSIAPTAAQLAQAASLDATADWNKFGTVNTLLKPGGFISTGYNGEPVAAARNWIRDNRVLFSLSEQGVADLVLVSDGRMPYNDAHFILFRQKFGDFEPTQDGQINVSIINGNVFHVWSSSAGDLGAPPAASLTPAQGWLAAAANVGRKVSVSDILAVKTQLGTDVNKWTLVTVAGFPQVQRVRLTALPTMSGDVRPVYEANVVYNLGHINEAYTLFVDAQSGDILTRANRVNHLTGREKVYPGSDRINDESIMALLSNKAALMPPATQVFQGTYVDAPAPLACGPRHPYLVPSGIIRLTATAAATVSTNDILIRLIFTGSDPDTAGDVAIGDYDTGTSPEAIAPPYEPAGGVPPGYYVIQVCPYNAPSAPAVAPYTYVGTFTTDDAPVSGGGAGSPYPPKWRYFEANPDLNYSNSDTRKTYCWESSVLGTPVPGCNFSLVNTAARAPWDWLSSASTQTTRGNFAQTAESWGSPLTPTTPYAPISSSREYIYPWNNEWRKYGGPTNPTNGKGCWPTLDHTGGPGTTDGDIDAAIIHLFATHNRFHDWSYLLGFTEQNSALQIDNYGNTTTARQNDPEIGNVQAGAVSGGPNGQYLGRDNANQITLQDGVPGITNQYLFQPIAAAFYAPCTDGSMDVAIVGHEYTHAVTNRMIGGPDANIGGHQGGSMGESWGDLDAAEYLNANKYVPTNDESPAAVGIYATGNKQLAIRDYAMAPNPLNYSNIGFDTPGPEVHSDGEPWNAINWHIRQALIDKYNATYPETDMTRQKACAEGKFNPENCPGNRRWVQLMFDSFLLMPASPSMVDARNSMLAADVARFGSANQADLWRVFGQRGIGNLAVSNGSGDLAPIPDFSSPLETNATVTFSAVAKDEGDATIPTAKIYVGHYEARSRPIADTYPATTVTADTRTNINDATAMFVAGTYDFVVQAPGYGMQRFTHTFSAGEVLNVKFSLPTNRASSTKGATITTTATVAADQTAKVNLIDDTENTGARIGTATTVSDDSFIVDLQGGSQLVTSINVSTLAGPTNGGRFTGIRKFAIDACNAGGIELCTSPASFTTIYTSPDDAFPAERPRPVQPQLNLRSFDVPDTTASHLRLRVIDTQCSGHPGFAGEQDDDPFAATDCETWVATPPAPPHPGNISRATEFQVFSSVPTVTGALGIENDVFPRPNGDGFVDSLDVGQVRRFQVGFDLPYQSNEFQRTDSGNNLGYLALGDGTVDALDVGQARRYQLAIDPLQPVGGPLAPTPFAEQGKSQDKGKGFTDLIVDAFTAITSGKTTEEVAVPREVRVVSQNVTPGQTITLALETDAMGDESIYGFSLNYETSVLTYVPNSVAIGSGATRQAGGPCDVLANTTTAGRIGFSVECFSSTITAGNNRQLVTMQFTVAAGTPNGSSPVTFGDIPAVRRVSSNPTAGPIQSLPTTFTNGSVNIASTRLVKVQKAEGSRRATVTVSLLADAAGDESIYGFTLNYVPSVLTYVPNSVTIGSGATRQGGGLCDVLENATTAGRIGFSIDCFNSTITSGTGRQLVTMQFTISATAPFGETPLTFSDTPVRRKTSSNPGAGPIQDLPTTFVDRHVLVLAPSAATVPVTGRVVKQNGYGLTNAIVTLTRDDGQKIRARTNAFGYFTFTNVEAGSSYVVEVRHKRYQFAPMFITVNDAISDLLLTAQ